MSLGCECGQGSPEQVPQVLIAAILEEVLACGQDYEVSRLGAAVVQKIAGVQGVVRQPLAIAGHMYEFDRSRIAE